MSTTFSAKPGISPEPRWVTKSQAQDWLALNKGNRSVSESHVRIWIDRFNLGRYQTTHQGIAFDEAGLLLDGQTRLTGLIRSEVAGMWVQVSTGVPRSAFAVMDAGRNRQAAQLIPGPHATAKGAAARYLLSAPRITQPKSGRIETTVLLDSYEAYREAIDEASLLAHQVYRECPIQTAAHTALLALVIASDGPPVSRIPEWVEGVSMGAGLPADDPRLALRNRWSVDRARLNGGGRESRDMAAYFITRAWNAYILGESMTKLQLPRGSKVTFSAIPEVAR